MTFIPTSSKQTLDTHTERVYSALAAYIKTYGKMPSAKELGHAVDMPAHGARFHLDRLEAAGRIEPLFHQSKTEPITSFTVGKPHGASFHAWRGSR